MLLKQNLGPKRSNFLNVRQNKNEKYSPFELLLKNGPSPSLLLFLEDSEARPFPGNNFQVT